MERAGYRIVDANFNRAREAVRVVEDYCRFALNSQPLAQRAKQLRHDLSAAISKLDTPELISSRDTPGDVGVGSQADRELGRTSLYDCLTAGCKRLTEALRVLAEVVRTDNQAVAKVVEQLRYDAYTLEKDIAVFAQPAQRFSKVRLYVIITSNLPSEVISLTNNCAAGAADCIQLRAKDMEDDSLLALAVEFAQICRRAGTLSIINDRVDIAVAAGADGVHLGRRDLPVEQARKLQLTPLIIGTSTHSLKEINAACTQLPTYISLGPVFASPTKPEVNVAGLEYLRVGLQALAGTGISHVAIGGITPDNIQDVLRAGAERVAVGSAVANASDPAAICRALRDKIEAFKEK